MDLAGPPYYANPAIVIEWTLPQVLFAWLRRQEDLAEQGRQEFTLRMLAIGAAMGGKQSKGIVTRVMKAFDGVPLSPEEVMDSLDETEKLVLYGKKKLSERQANSDPH